MEQAVLQVDKKFVCNPNLYDEPPKNVCDSEGNILFTLPFVGISMYTGHKIYQGLVTVDREIANKILEKNTSNRTPGWSVIGDYARLMKKNMWGDCDGMIIISNDDVLIEGQQRCYSVFRSGRPQQFTVSYGHDFRMQAHCGRGRKRTLSDNIELEKLFKGKHSLLARTIRKMASGCDGYVRMTDAELMDFYLYHKDANDFAVNLFTTKEKNVGRITTGPVVASVARASYYIDNKDIIGRFSQVLISGVTQGDTESAAIALRDWLLNDKNKGGSAGGVVAFSMAQVALHSFIRGLSLTRDKLKPWKKRLHKDEKPKKHNYIDLFPLPEYDPATGISHGITKLTVSWYRKRFSDTDNETNKKKGR